MDWFGKTPRRGPTAPTPPRLGLIDYGQVGRLTREQRVNYANFIAALAAGDRPRTVRLITEVLGKPLWHAWA